MGQSRFLRNISKALTDNGKSAGRNNTLISEHDFYIFYGDNLFIR